VTTGRVRETLHFEKANLIQASGEYINDVAIVRNSFGEVIVKLISLDLWGATGYHEHTFKAFL
jgi:hypothetical protein